MSISPHYYSTVGRSTSTFSGFFIDFQRSDADRRTLLPIRPLQDEVYKVPCFCDDPVALKNFCDREDAYFPERTYQWLTNFGMVQRQVTLLVPKALKVLPAFEPKNK